MFKRAMYIEDKKVRRGPRNKSAIGGFSMFVGILALCIFLSLIGISTVGREELKSNIHSLAFLDMLLCLCGVYLSLKGANDNTGNFKEAIIGLVINSLLFIIMIVMFLIGIA